MLLEFVPDCYAGQMCENGVDSHSWLFLNVTNQYNTPEMREKTVEDDSYILKYVQDRCKIRKLWRKRIDAIKKVASISYWFAIILLLQECRRCCKGCEEKIQEHLTGYKRQKSKVKTKDELNPIAWFPSRWRG